MKKTLVKNSIYSVIQVLINIIVLFIAVPVFIKYLSTELYGLFSVVSIIGNLNVFVNLGLNNALIKFVAE